MSCDGYTVKMPDGTEFCIPIYREVDRWDGPDPGPEGRLFRDIWILATIHDGIAHISDRGVRDTLAKSVQGAARSMNLPKGLQLGDRLFKGEKTLELAE
jgi:hypothetical protein